ncbi:MAG: sigma-54-dependent Fis family transcriptional regulator [Rhodobacteraceae bacterium]|nr:sigma-54-dependent Fis family transcriptional regulator [Paracoccaceae bacterium]
MAKSAIPTNGLGHLRAAQYEYDERETMRAWEKFLINNRVLPEGACPVRTEILQSWSRSSSSGIDAQANEAPMPYRSEAISRLKHANRDLREAARGAFSQIGKLLEGSDAMLILTDGNGVIIETIGDERTLDDGREIHLEIGGVWGEDAIGTNGIGTALRTGCPIFVHASEHFCAGIKCWTCAGAPIRDPFDQSVIGVVDLSGPTEIFRRHNTALVAAAASEIQRVLGERQQQERARLLEAFIESGPARGERDGVVLLDRYGRVVYNRNMPKATQNAGAFAMGQRLVDPSRVRSEAEIAAALPCFLEPRGVSFLRLDGEVRGTALIISGDGPSTRRAERAAPARKLPVEIVGDCPKLAAAIDLARRAAEAGASVLVQGETGVGKELFARLVHAEARKAAPFVALNCGAISRDLIGAELFGHVAGAFTGAVREGKPGKFELADKGVLCLDEIGEMPQDMQPYLLRVLEQRAVWRIGDSRRRPVDVQLVALTNRDLLAEVEQGRFRRDLYYRLGTVTIHVPPLRERGDDILTLAEHFSLEFSERQNRPLLHFPDEVRELMRAYGWPGNVRELRNLIERLYLLVRGRDVSLEDLPPEMRAAGQGGAAAKARPEDGARSLEDLEEEAIRNTIRAEKGNLSRVAATLGISRPTLYRKMRLYDIRRVYE